MPIFASVMTEFSTILADALDIVASEHGLTYREGGAAAWGHAGAAYLSFALCGLPPARLRALQYSARQITGPILLDCKWYDRLAGLCMNGRDDVMANLPAPDGGLSERNVPKSLFLEMLDFCREG